MRAWLVEQPGAADALELGDIPLPEPGPEEVRVALRAVGINRADVLQRRGLYPPPPGFDARIPGLEYAGVVAATGARVRGRVVGDPVMGLIGGGAYAEQIVAHERETLTVPQGMTFADAAAIPEAFLTAYRAVFLEGGLAPGQWCLVRGATSSVGQAALQLIRALGARSIATSRQQARLDALAEVGFDVGLVDGGDNVAQAVQAQTGGAHVVLDFVGAPALSDNLAALRSEGAQVMVGLMGGSKSEINLGVLLMRRLRLVAMTMRSLPLERKIALAQMFDDRLLPLFASGALRPLVDRVFAFDQAVAAHEFMESGAHCGKLVLSLEA
ncbi:MAG: NAD(P)H-quinone oxidoreductase [Salinisphaera sp.]|nr:NAD(P)H-quinone oxidoreductase [Salinisphaera sp.]